MGELWTGAALHVAACGASVTMAKQLIEGNADLGLKDSVSAAASRPSPIAACTQTGATALHLAVREGKPATVQLLADAKAGLDAQDQVCRARPGKPSSRPRTGPARAQAGWTPLHWAACKGRGPVAIELIRRGASVDARSKV
jgi:ankyrin repeat protein